MFTLQLSLFFLWLVLPKCYIYVYNSAPTFQPLSAIRLDAITNSPSNPEVMVNLVAWRDCSMDQELVVGYWLLVLACYVSESDMQPCLDARKRPPLGGKSAAQPHENSVISTVATGNWNLAQCFSESRRKKTFKKSLMFVLKLFATCRFCKWPDKSMLSLWSLLTRMISGGGFLPKSVCF